jgi:hypothetical protein
LRESGEVVVFLGPTTGIANLTLLRGHEVGPTLIYLSLLPNFLHADLHIHGAGPLEPHDR